MMIATNGVANRIMTQEPKTLNKDPMNILIMLGITESMVSISLAKRLTRLPLGVFSKKDMGDRRTSYSKDWWR